MQVSRESPRYTEGTKATNYTVFVFLSFLLPFRDAARASICATRRDAMHFSFFSSFARRFFPRKGATPSTRRMRNASTSDRLRELHRLGIRLFFLRDNLCLRSILSEHTVAYHIDLELFTIIYVYDPEYE